MDAKFFESNRKALAKMMTPGSLCIIPAKPILSDYLNKLPHYEQNSEFYYMTGILEPNAIMVLIKHAHKKLEYVLFSIEDKVENVPLMGHVMGTEGALAHGADKAYVLSKLDKVMPKLLTGIKTIYHPFESQAPYSKKISHWRDKAQTYMDRHQKKGNLPIETKDVSPLVSLLRRIKSPEEIENIEQAASISTSAFERVLNKYDPHMSEFEMARKFEASIQKQSQCPMATHTVVAFGKNATALYHKPTQEKASDDALIVLQGGAQYNDYAAPIARTFPASGTFTEEQAQLYNLLLKAQAEGLKYLKPHHSIEKAESKMLAVLSKGFKKLGILPEDKGEFHEKESMRRICPQEMISFVGLDARDPFVYKPGSVGPKIKRHMTFCLHLTVCIPEDDLDIPKAFRGIGLRLSDVILTTLHNNRVLTNAPKTICEIENALKPLESKPKTYLPVYMSTLSSADLTRQSSQELEGKGKEEEIYCETCEEDNLSEEAFASDDRYCALK